MVELWTETTFGITSPLANACELRALIFACTRAAIWQVRLHRADFAKFVWSCSTLP